MWVDLPIGSKDGTSLPGWPEVRHRRQEPTGAWTTPTGTTSAVIAAKPARPATADAAILRRQEVQEPARHEH